MTTILVKDPLRDSVEAASSGKQTVLWTKSGFPSYMNVIPKFRLEELHPTALGTGIHPAFLVNGVEKSEIFIGTYQAVIQDGEAISLPGQVPATRIDFDAARAACIAAGPGFHLMTNLEWAAIALWCHANGHDVRGNTNSGCSHSNPEERGKLAKNSNLILTGSGPSSWRHDGTPFGIADLVGNVWEWNDGLKLVSGEIITTHDNDFNLQEGEWPATGIFIDLPGGSPTISSRITRRGWNGSYFKDVTAADGFDVPAALRQALLHPGETSLSGYYWADNQEGFEALPIRGGDWLNDSDAGLGALHLDCERSVVSSCIGFRPAFIE